MFLSWNGSYFIYWNGDNKKHCPEREEEFCLQLPVGMAFYKYSYYENISIHNTGEVQQFSVDVIRWNLRHMNSHSYLSQTALAI